MLVIGSFISLALALLSKLCVVSFKLLLLFTTFSKAS